MWYTKISINVNLFIMSEQVNFETLELVPCQAAPVKTEVLEVKVSTNQLSQGYVSAIMCELCTNPRGEATFKWVRETEEFKKCPLNATNLERYLAFLLDQRCLFIANKCTNFGMLRGLYIPSYWQFVLSMIGEVRLRSRAILIRPISAEKSDMTIDEAYAISIQLDHFGEILHLHNAAMPRTKEGHADVMTSALIADQLRSMTDSVHPALAYVSAIADMKLAEEAKFAVLYRVQYDDIANFVRQSSFRKTL